MVVLIPSWDKRWCWLVISRPSNQAVCSSKCVIDTIRRWETNRTRGLALPLQLAGASVDKTSTFNPNPGRGVPYSTRVDVPRKDK
jgi:hypothetical protein